MRGQVVVLAAACGATPDHEPAPQPAAAIRLDWHMRDEGSQLRIDYTVKNATATRITVVDALPVHGSEPEDEIVVHAADAADVVAFTRAFVAPERGFKPMNEPSPRYRELAAGAELRGTAHTRLPLGASHNYAGSYAITGTRTRAVLEIGYYDDPAINAGNAATAPRVGPHAFKLLRSPPQPLPPGVRVASPDEQVARSYGRVVLPP